MNNIKTMPNAVFDEYRYGCNYKASVGDKGINEQSKINERFYVGDQWHGARCGSERPLVRRNVIRRIGEQKLSSIATAPVAVSFSAQGIPDNAVLNEQKLNIEKNILSGGDFSGNTKPAEISFITDVLSDYFRVTAERVKFEAKKEQLLRNAYISGTGIAYTYWDSLIDTGLFADEGKSHKIKGDINFEILNVENVVFGDPNKEDVQAQPYIIISQRLELNEVIRMAKRNGVSAEKIAEIAPDSDNLYNINAGARGESEPTGSNRITLLTKFWKEWDKTADSYKIMCEKVTEKVLIKKPWDLGIKLYPFAKICWLPRFSSAYGDSEVTYMIPNQIAINRALSAEIWSMMTTGMPITVVNGDIVTEPLTNTPGQILKVFGGSEDVAGAIRHIQPPLFSSQLINAVDSLANNTLSDAGATDAALGNLRPDNAAAIIQVREAALQPMQLIQNNFYSCIEDIARIWADFWIHNYGNRPIKYENKEGSFYIPFHAERYEGLLLNARIDVGASPLWDISSTVAMLDQMYDKQLINRQQYFERIPAGIVPDITELIEASKADSQIQSDAIPDTPAANDGDTMALLARQYPKLYEKLNSLSDDQKQKVLERIGMGGSIPSAENESEVEAI